MCSSDLPRDDIATDVAAELHRMAEWLGLGGVEVQRKGDLAVGLTGAVRNYARTR